MAVKGAYLGEKLRTLYLWAQDSPRSRFFFLRMKTSANRARLFLISPGETRPTENEGRERGEGWPSELHFFRRFLAAHTRGAAAVEIVATLKYILRVLRRSAQQRWRPAGRGGGGGGEKRVVSGAEKEVK